MQELFKILNIYNIKNNASNNSILKKKLKKTLNRRDILWDKAQNSIFYITYIINLVAQEFIKAIDLKISNNNTITLLENDQVKNIIASIKLCIIVKKIFLKIVMQTNNASTNK